MDLNVKLQGLKSNFRKIQGVFLQNSRASANSRFIELFFY
jgi:hypothetical protein